MWVQPPNLLLMLPYLRDDHPAMLAISMFTGPWLFTWGLFENTAAPKNPMIYHPVHSQKNEKMPLEAYHISRQTEI